MLYEIEKNLIEYRKHLHKIPELGFKEFKTKEYIKKTLISLGFEIELVAKTGIIGIKKGKSKFNIAFRADMDGLEIEEKNDIEYKSIHQGLMHACGHDGHMAILLGFADYISKITELDYGVVLIFQPAEEGPGGANLIINENIFKKYNIKAIFGLHIFPDIEEGKICLKEGPLMARTGEFDINVIAKSCHGAMPHKGIDSIYVASNLINIYQSIVSRNINPNESAVVSIGKIIGGDRRNIIAESVRLEGTIRAFNDNIYNFIKKRMLEINKGLEIVFGVNIDIEIRDMYPPVINDSNIFSFLKSIFNKNEIVEIDKLMISEDFSYYQQEIPGFFILLGSRNEEEGFIYPLHSNRFNFSDKVLIKGLKIYKNIYENLREYLGGKNE